MGLNILHVIQTINPKGGGPIEGIHQQTKAHKFFGHSVEIVSLDSPDCSFVLSSQIKVFPCIGSWADKFYPFTLCDWIKSNHGNYDAIIVNGIWGLHLLAVWRALRNTETPYFVFCHGMLDPWFKNQFPFKHYKKWLVWPWAIYPCLRDADSVFFTCRKEKLLARNSFWLYDCNESVIQYGTEGIPNSREDYSAAFFASHLPLVGKRIFLFLGRVHPKKGPDLLIQAIALLREQGAWDSRTMKLVFAGPNDSKYAINLSKLAEKLRVSDSIYWSGMVSGKQKWGAFQSAEAFVLPSHQENFGIAVVEALSCGIPVLISHSVNIANEIINDCAGLVEPDTLKGTTLLFRRWLALNTTEKAKMKISARQCFKSRFGSIQTSTSITRNIYLALLERAATGNS